jgi:rhamnosyltransferase
VIGISPDDFNHGRTRNFGIEHTRGELIVLIVQDAVPVSSHWLANLVSPLFRDPELAGSWARQIPRPDASPLTRHLLARWFASRVDTRITTVPGIEAFRRMTPLERFQTCLFDNVCSCIRRSVWQRFPFREVRIAEDLEWSKDVLLAGYGLVYVSYSVVIHSHDRPARYELMRAYLVHQQLRALFGVSGIPNLWSLFRAIVVTMAVHLKYATQGSLIRTPPRELARALALAIAFPLGHYLGVRSADTGRELLRVSGV